VVQNSFPNEFTVGICKIISLYGERCITRKQYKWKLQSLLFLSDVWELYQSNQRKKIEESQELVRDAAIAVGRHVSPLRGKR